MARENVYERKACVTIHWEVENFSFCWERKGECIFSPEFTVDSMRGIRWILWLYPRHDRNRNSVSYYLQRLPSEMKDIVEVEVEFFFLAEDGSILKEAPKERKTFEVLDYWGADDFVMQEEVLTTSKKAFLQRDVLRTRCKIWRPDVTNMWETQMFAKTIINCECKSFVWNIEGFCPTIYGIEYPIISASGKKVAYLKLFAHTIYEIEIRTVPFPQCVKRFSLQTFLIDSKRNKIDCGLRQYSDNSIFRFAIPFIPNRIMQNKDMYLNNDTLSLYFECAFSTGDDIYVLERIDSEISALLNRRGVHLYSGQQCITPTVNQREDGSDLKADITSLYKDGILCDATLRTETETFLAHSLVLSARSPVFRAMFDSDFKEKFNGIVDIVDLEDDTLRRMIQYMYTDIVDEITWESALKLFTAADKYQVEALKKKCSCFLRDNLCHTNVCDVLVFSDLHQDDVLKRSAQAYILQHAEVVLNSDKWKMLMKNNITLTSETMYMNWKKD
ncbi:TD and POZ domain-containing protein 5 [Nephila pilipes]|uniref:TD and POZ domain-containing protein 5 n=1 Tax=Nephila pilipes TaxID=299642 RepID=A0A8X6NG52_NEPPI|nr:TD and POZ domain-containing protein 5 [Nephila pilipes]